MQEPYTISRVNTNTSQKPTRILILLLSIIFKYFLCFLFPQLKKECEFSYKYPHKNSTANISEVELIIDFAWAMINKARILSFPVFQLRTLNKSSLPGRLR